MNKNSLAVVGCVEQWAQKPTADFLAKKKDGLERVRMSIFGGVKNREVLMGQLRTTLNPLKVKEVNLISHEGCGAYIARKFANKSAEREALENDLRNTRAAIMAEMPKLKVKIFILTKKPEILEVE